MGEEMKIEKDRIAHWLVTTCIALKCERYEKVNRRSLFDLIYEIHHSGAMIRSISCRENCRYTCNPPLTFNPSWRSSQGEVDRCQNDLGGVWEDTAWEAHDRPGC